MPRMYLNASALVENYCLIKERTHGCLIPVLKADAYGHGALFALAHLLEAGARLFAVACAYEAHELLAYIEKSKPCFANSRIFVMGEVAEEALPALLCSRIILSVHSPAYAERLSRAVAHAKERFLVPAHFSLCVHLKLETGMHRLGIRSLAGIKRVLSLPHLTVTGAYSHLFFPADAARTAAQKERFAALLTVLPPHTFTHLSASEGLLRYGDLSHSAARAGLALYGVPPAGLSLPLSPVMRLSLRVLSTFTVGRGAYVGYGCFRAPRRMRLAVLDAGYADGIPPHAGEGGALFLKGARCPLVGAVCMDRCTLDIGALPLREGEEVTLFGETAGDTARAAEALGVSPYVLLTLRSARTERVLLQ